MRIAHEEIFAPVAAIHEYGRLDYTVDGEYIDRMNTGFCFRFEDETEVVSRANSTRSGLAGYLFSKDQSQIYRVTRSLQVGMIGVNEGKEAWSVVWLEE